MSSNNDQNINSLDPVEGGDLNIAVGNREEVVPKSSPEERIVALEELQDEAEYSEEEYNQMLDFYEKTMSDFVEGELVVGKILAVSDKEVAVDIGFKSEGVIPIEEFSHPEAIDVGDDIEVFLDNVEDSDGQLVLSKKKADFLRVWEKIISSYDNDEILKGTCTRRIKGGMVVDLMGVDAFLPGSQIDVKPIRDFDALIGQEMEFKIVKVNEARKNIVVSHRVLIEEGMKEQRQKILENLEKGQVLEGGVKNITDFGVFIDLGGVDGLLHINDLSWGRVSHPSEIVSLDEKISVQVLDFNEAKDRISLGLKQLQPHPWDNVRDKYKEGDVIKGKVVNISDYGSFIELEKGIEGLIHISEMSWTQHIKHPSKLLSLGEIVDAKILNIDYDGRKISLGLKQLEPDPWDGIEAKYPVDSRQKGVVRNLTNFGAFVELEEGVDGLIHISDLSWTKKIRHPGEVVKKGDEVEVVVLNIDQGNRRISLGFKQTMENPWETFEMSYKPRTKTTGKIVRMIEKGVIVELPETVDGFVPMSQLTKEGIRKPSDGYQVGDELTLVVIEFSKENKKIILSEKLTVDESAAALARDDQEAIAEFEKEVAGSEGARKRAAAKASAKAAAAKASAKKAEQTAAAPEDAVAESEAEAEQAPVAAESDADGAETAADEASEDKSDGDEDEPGDAIASEPETAPEKAEAQSEKAKPQDGEAG
ncbi:MAG: 30S ribosomal protein S1 [bacterium]